MSEKLFTGKKHHCSLYNKYIGDNDCLLSDAHYTLYTILPM